MGVVFFLVLPFRLDGDVLQHCSAREARQKSHILVAHGVRHQVRHAALFAINGEGLAP